MSAKGGIHYFGFVQFLSSRRNWYPCKESRKPFNRINNKPVIKLKFTRCFKLKS